MTINDNSCYRLVKRVEEKHLVVEVLDGVKDVVIERYYLADVSERGKRVMDETIAKMGWGNGTEVWK